MGVDCPHGGTKRQSVLNWCWYHVCSTYLCVRTCNSLFVSFLNWLWNPNGCIFQWSLECEKNQPQLWIPFAFSFWIPFTVSTGTEHIVLISLFFCRCKKEWVSVWYNYHWIIIFMILSVELMILSVNLRFSVSACCGSLHRTVVPAAVMWARILPILCTNTPVKCCWHHHLYGWSQHVQTVLPRVETKKLIFLHCNFNLVVILQCFTEIIPNSSH